MASAIICLVDNQKFNFSKYIFDNMVKSLEGGVKFYLFPRFLQVFLDNQVERMERNKEMYIIASHTKKIFANMRRIGTGFSEKTQKPRRKQRKEAEVSYDELEDEDHVPTPLVIYYLVKSKIPMEKDGLGDQEDASKHERMIREIDQNADIALDDETYGRTNDDEMFGVDDLAGEEVVMETTTGVKDSYAPTDVTEDDVTMAQALAALKSIKPKVVVQEQEMSTTIIAAATTVTTVVPTPRAKGLKGLKSDQSARKLEAEEQEAARLSRAQQDEEANNPWDNMQAMMARLLVELIEKKETLCCFESSRKKKQTTHQNSYEKPNVTYLKHMGGYKQSQLKEKSFDEIKKLFDKEMRKVNDFIAMDSETQESSTKRTAEHLESDISKKQKVDENVKPVINDSEELKKCMEIVLDDGDEVLIEATPLSSRSPTIIDYKIHKEGKKNYFKIIRVDGDDCWDQSLQGYTTVQPAGRNRLRRVICSGHLIGSRLVIRCEEVYVNQPDEFVGPHHPDKVYRLKKALYGLKQAPRVWYDELSNFLVSKTFSKGANKLVRWSSKKQGCTSMSSEEAKYVSLSACYAQVLWLRTQLTEYGFHFDKIPMYCDSKAAIAISCNPV
nr:Gag-Pol polyprotein [Tanacetum cinerariifolium]